MISNAFYQIDSKDASNTDALSLVLLQPHALADLSLLESRLLKSQSFSGAYGDVAVLVDESGFPNRVFIGFGAGNQAVAIATAVTKLPQGFCYRTVLEIDATARLAWSLAQYRFDHYKINQTLPRVLMVEESHYLDVLFESNAVFLVRDLINMPTNALGPSQLAERVLSLAQEHGAVFQEWVGDALLQAGFPAIHAVGRAAADAPRLLSFTWGDSSHPRVTLVGKGVCFDSGGLDIKPASAMRFMKKDMGGAAHVMGLAQWMMAKKLPVYLTVLIPAVENAVGSRAFRPGDVLTMRNGLTVEIDNTDAEGRLILADALVKACEDKPDLLIDFATLTGAARVAVGTEIAAFFTPNDELAESVYQCSLSTQDAAWRLPLFSGYASLLDSAIADMTNSTASPYAGAITAALFLNRFIAQLSSWIHFDIMAWNVGSKPGRPEGGEAMGMLAMGRYLLNRYSNRV